MTESTPHPQQPHHNHDGTHHDQQGIPAPHSYAGQADAPSDFPIPSQPAPAGGHSSYSYPGYNQMPSTGGFGETSSTPGPQGHTSSHDAYGSAHQSYAPYPGADSIPFPPPGTRGVYQGPISGNPMKPSDEKIWAALAQASMLLGYTGVIFSWIPPLVLFLVFKDRSRFVRFHAAEALNLAITYTLANILLSTVLLIFTLITFGIGAFALPLLSLIPIIHVVLAIVATVKAFQSEWWNIPLNIRFVS